VAGSLWANEAKPDASLSLDSTQPERHCPEKAKRFKQEIDGGNMPQHHERSMCWPLGGCWLVCTRLALAAVAAPSDVWNRSLDSPCRRSSNCTKILLFSYYTGSIQVPEISPYQHNIKVANDRRNLPPQFQRAANTATNGADPKVPYCFDHPLFRGKPTKCRLTVRSTRLCPVACHSLHSF